MTLWKTVSTICIRATSSVGGSTIPSRDKSLLRMVEPFIYNFCQNTVKLHWKSLYRLYKSQYVEKRKQKIPTEVAKMKKKKMVDEMIIGVIKEALLRRVEPTAQVVSLMRWVQIEFLIGINSKTPYYTMMIDSH